MSRVEVLQWKREKKYLFCTFLLCDFKFDCYRNFNTCQNYDELLSLQSISSFFIVIGNYFTRKKPHDRRNGQLKQRYNIINSKNIDLKILNNLDFKTVDYRRFPLTKILNNLPEKSSLFETILVSINDKLVELFLGNKIKFTDISKKMHNILRLKNLKKYKMIKVTNINEIIKINNDIKNRVERIIRN